ncbi:MAG: Crp/Fnr family transcriptional regulator [Cyclobacteriaceae bacterium]
MDAIQLLRQKIETRDLWSKTLVLKRNEFLLRPGQVEKYMYFILAGSLRAFVVDRDEEMVIRFAYKNSIFTALDSFLSGRPTLFNIQAIKQCKLMAIEKSNFQKLIREDESSIELYIMLLEQLTLQQIEREMDLLTFSPSDRYQRVLTRSPHLFQEIPNKHIASYLRMTPETLSRLKKS